MPLEFGLLTHRGVDGVQNCVGRLEMSLLVQDGEVEVRASFGLNMKCHVSNQVNTVAPGTADGIQRNVKAMGNTEG